MVYPADSIRKRGSRTAVGCARPVAHASLRSRALPGCARLPGASPTQVSLANNTKRGLYVYQA